MVIKKRPDLKYSEITPKTLYLRRREFIAGSAALAACAIANPLLGKELREQAQENRKAQAEGEPLPQKPEIAKRSRLISSDDKLTAYEEAAGYTNFYEFSTAKRDPTRLARDFRTRPWTVAVEGLVKSPRQFTIDDLIRFSPLEERITALALCRRLVHGHPLDRLLARRTHPRNASLRLRAKFVEFHHLYDPEQMPFQKTTGFAVAVCRGTADG